MSNVTITHTHADGTLLEGSSKGDGVYEIVRSHGFTWRRSVGILILASRDKAAQMHKINGAADALRAAGHEVTVDVDDTWRPTAEREADRTDRAEDRADWLAGRAQLAATRADAAIAKVHSVADHIPFGQPILVGHHSEGKARSALAKIEAGMRKSVDETRYARDLASRADGVIATLEHRHDPRVTMRRIEKLEADLRAAERVGRSTDRLAEEIAHWRGVLDKLAADGEFVAWTKEDFQRGDWVRSRGTWYPVRRSNAKSVSVPGGYGITGRADSSWSDTIKWSEVSGRRRDGMQWDTPHGKPWPVEQAQKVAKWMSLVRRAKGVRNYDDDGAVAMNVRFALRIAVGLDPLASIAELEAYGALTEKDGPERRALAVACLAVYKRLEAGEKVSDVVASTQPFTDITPTWTMPAGEPENVRADEVQKGDVVAGFVDRNGGLDRYWTGPVEAVMLPQGEEYSGERFVGYVTITLTTANARQFKPWHQIAVHRAPAQEPVG